MKIERGAFARDNIAAMVTFKSACLGCSDCSGACWQFHELRSLPESVLRHEGGRA